MFFFWSASKPAPESAATPSLGTPSLPTPSPPVPAPESIVAPPTSQPLESSRETQSSLFSKRSLKQLGLFAAGGTFLALSTTITRRAVVRRQLAALPKFYQPSSRAAGQGAEGAGAEGSRIAIEALNLATLNVVSFGIMMAGGVAWAFDISSIDDLRAYARVHVEPPGVRTDEALEEEVAELAAKMLGWKNRTGGGDGQARGRGDS